MKFRFLPAVFILLLMLLAMALSRLGLKIPATVPSCQQVPVINRTCSPQQSCPAYEYPA